mmetsp:Transcript_11777/g.28815  ORF Transcript_11777/g.28815 Transcript_11777/m.28815 type:complete len:212 (+) Transcript_11777:741-1376(+)
MVGAIVRISVDVGGARRGLCEFLCTLCIAAARIDALVPVVAGYDACPPSCSTESLMFACPFSAVPMMARLYSGLTLRDPFFRVGFPSSKSTSKTTPLSSSSVATACAPRSPPTCWRLISISAACRNATSKPFISRAPRPHTYPSLILPENGPQSEQLCALPQCSSVPSSIPTTSRWPITRADFMSLSVPCSLSRSVNSPTISLSAAAKSFG